MKRSTSRRKRSLSEPVVGGLQNKARLSKPPKIESLHERPRNRLQKRSTAMGITLTPYPAQLGIEKPKMVLHLLEEEPYPYNTLPSKFLGVYSTVDSVTAGAIEHGAYTFSREGVLDGSEYLNTTGRIRIQRLVLQHFGTEAAVSTRSHSIDERPVEQIGPIRSDIPHPTSRSNTLNKTTRTDMLHLGAQSQTSLKSARERKDVVYLAIRQGPTESHCLGIFARPSLAWGACLKNKANCAVAGTLSKETRDMDAEGMPRAMARLHGCGQHVWFIAAKEVDATAR